MSEPIELIPGADASDVLFICDHASNQVPGEYGDLGLPQAQFARHIAWDIGAAAATRRLAELFQAPAVLTCFSRLLIDPNRGADDPTLVMRISDGAIIPGNAGIDEAEIERRRGRYWRPYRDAIGTALEAMMACGKTPAIVSLHSFTPAWKNFQRPWQMAVLWDTDDRIAHPLIEALRAGGLTIGVASLVLLAFHQLQIQRSIPGSWWGAAERSSAILLPAAFWEELFFRGYAFSVLRRAAGWRTALVVTSIAFGLIHAGNPGADAESILAVTVAGFFLGIILLATRSLYAAGIAHFAWNWVMAVALHIEVSGMTSAYPDYRTIETGPDWLTGGRWGPEGGLAAVVAMFVGIFYLYGRYLRRMEWKA